jgi:hypothetical protein
MIECILTLDYEIYGDGGGSLKGSIYEPAEKLRAVLRKWDARCVVFVEVAELEIVGSERADPAIKLIERQLCEFHREGFEIGLHLHPQWYNARYQDDHWKLDYGEYNLCRLPPERIDQIIDRSIEYLRKALRTPGYSPFSFRAGNWLMQPADSVARILARYGIKVDSSVFKGGVQHQHQLDYRRSCKNGYYWRFSEDANVPDHQGVLLEIPTFTKMVPIWKMLTAKRLGLQKMKPAKDVPRQFKLSRLRDFARIRHPMKLDFCRLTASEMIRIFDQEMKQEKINPSILRPIVAIGHTKDLIDVETIESFLAYLKEKGVPVSTFKDVHAKIMIRDQQA